MNAVRTPMIVVSSEISGVIANIEVAVGEDVTEGQTLCLLHSMKMEIPVEAQVAGTVREIMVSDGDTVAEGDPILRLEPAV